MGFTREELESYEKRPQKQVDDKVNPFRGATPAKAADPAALAAVQAGQVDATPGGAPAAAVAAPDPLVDDSPVVDEDGTLGDQSVTGEGTSTDENSEGASTSAVDPGDETDPNTDLTGEQPAEEEAATAPAPKKGSAAERIVEALDLAEGYKVFGKHMQDQLKEALAELARLKGGGTPAPSTTAAVAPPVVEKDEPMPDLGDSDVNYDTDKYREKMTKWVKAQGRIEARRAMREEQGVSTAARVRETVEAKCEAFAKDHPDFKDVVANNPVLAQNNLAPDASFAVAQSEYTAELLYRFGQDPALAIRVARQSPAQQLLTVGKMIAQIEIEKTASKGKTVATAGKAAPQAGAKPATTKSITKAPPPPRPTQAAGRPAARDVLDPNMDMGEFARLHRAGKESARTQNRKARGLN